jgi:hypothetical protein
VFTLFMVLGTVSVFGGVVGRFLKAKGRAEKAARLTAWQAAAAACGLTDVSVRGHGMTGHRGPLTVRLSAYVITGENRGTKISVEGVPRWLTIRRPDPNVPSTDGVATGDVPFDEALVVVGRELDVHAALDAGARRRHLALLVPRRVHQTLFATAGVDPEATVGEGRVATRRPDEPVQERADRIRDALELLLAVAESWTSPLPTVERVAAIARRDPDPNVRLQSLHALLQHAREDAVVPPLLEDAFTDPDPEVRLAAAMASGRGGRETLLAYIADPATRDEAAARVIDRLGPDADAAEVAGWLTRAQRAGNVASVVACLHQLARPRLPVPQAFVDALADDEPRVREAAARLLGVVGSSAAHVIELRRAAETHESDDVFVRLARASVASIQSRLVGAEHGQLAVAADAGELSLAVDADGRVTLPDGEPR